jgi:hypothetical protein
MIKMSFNISCATLFVCCLAVNAGKSPGSSKTDSWLTPEGRIVEKSHLPKSVLKRLTTPKPAKELDQAGKNGISDYSFQIAEPGKKLVKPLRELAYSAKNIERIREEARSNPKLKPLISSLLKQVTPWLKLTDDELKSLLPSPDAVIAAPTAGDPKVNKILPRMCGQEFLGRGDRGVEFCTLEKPGFVYSPNTKEWYGDEKPGEKYYDPGTGWVREDGKRFYFKGYWNLWVLIEMHRAMDNLAFLYMLSGDEILARRALQIMDLLSDLRKKRNPDTCYLGIYSTLPAPGKGFLAFNGNHANSRQILSAVVLDILANSKYAVNPSTVDPKTTIFEAARKHYFQAFEMGYLNRSLQNHALMLYGNIAAQGVLFGYPNAVKLGIESVYAYLDVCVYRDGDYYETADGYGRIGKRYIYQVMQSFNYYDPARYDNPELFPQPEKYPFKLKFGNSPIWFNNSVKAQFRMSIYGRNFRFGDTHPDRVWGAGDSSLKKWTDKEKGQFLRVFASQTDNKEWLEECRVYFDKLKDSEFLVPDEFSIKSYGESQWFYLAPPENKTVKKEEKVQSLLTPGRLLITLKSGEGKNERAVFSRSGVPTSHGHDDQMGIQLYGKTGCMTGFYGYGRNGAARPDFFGYSVKAASHQMAIINEDIPQSYLFKKTGSAADVLSFLPVPPAQCFEVSNPAMWKRQKGDEYRRLVWLIDVNKEDFYMLDIFRLGGGFSHDYIRFAPYLDRKKSDSLKITGVNPEKIPGVWSLAGFNGRYRKAVFNQPGKSWGERLQLNGYIKDIGVKSEKKLLKKRNWNPAPGNGYGFIYDVKGVQTNNDWLCEWIMPKGIPYKQRLYMVNYDGHTAVRAKAPTEQNFDSNYEIVVARRTKGKDEHLRSRFVAVSELAEPSSWTIRKVIKANVKTGDNPKDIVAVWIELADGRRDLIISCAKESTVEIDGIKFTGQRAFLRFGADKKLECLTMEAASELSVDGLTVKPQEAVWQASVLKFSASDMDNKIMIDKKFPSSLSGSTTLIDNDKGVAYSHNSYYKVESINDNILKFGDQSLIGINIEVDKVDKDGVVTSRWPMELVGRFNFDYFVGHKITNARTKRSGIILSQKNTKDLKIKPSNLLKPGDKAYVWVAKTGDSVSIPSWVNVKKVGNGYEVKANSPLQLMTSDGSKHFIDSKELAKKTVNIKMK